MTLESMLDLARRIVEHVDAEICLDVTDPLVDELREVLRCRG